MTVTIRIQYKGEGARKLLAEEHSQDRDTAQRYAEDVNRALSMFAIPHPPHSSKVIWKSGFVLCNYNTSKDTPFFEKIYRGVFRAQSGACRATLEGLHISYIHLFENSKPIIFGKQAQLQQQQEDGASLPSPRGNFAPRPRSRSPPRKHYHKQHWTRPLGPEHSAPELLRQPPLAEGTQGKHRSQSVDRKVAVKSEPFEDVVPAAHSGGSASNGAAGSPNISEALKKLAGSQTLLSLLGHTPTSTSAGIERPTKQECDSPKRLEPPRAPRSLLSSASNEGTRDLSITRPLSPPPRSNGSGYYSRDDRSSRPPTMEVRHDWNSRSFNNHSNRQAFSPTPHRGRSSSPAELRGVPYEPALRYAGYGADATQAPNFPQKKWFNRSRSPCRRRPYNVDKLDAPSLWSKGPLKRPLSPTLTPGRAGSPPPKRRFSVNNATNPARGTPLHVDVAAAKLSTPTAGSGGTNGTHAARGTAPPSALVSSSTLSASGPGVNGSETAQPFTRNQQIMALNRELWDVRRQITAMKAREDSILSDLKTLRAPELPEGMVMPAKAPGPEDRLRLLEAEITSLRSRLQSETVRRQLVEEACENERRRRKHAEDLLDDARRESNTPIVVPAMMDAFERIAQLTGEALMAASEQEQPAAKVW